uniref:Uncharacterized protein n=1 Tax=Helicotheca tamesis TaxID=374047 RepID=A0A7S2HC90_9STRA
MLEVTNYVETCHRRFAKDLTILLSCKLIARDPKSTALCLAAQNAGRQRDSTVRSRAISILNYEFVFVFQACFQLQSSLSAQEQRSFSITRNLGMFYSICIL